MSPRGSLRSAGWIAVLAACATLFVVLTFRVNAVKSEVRLAERRIVALQREKMLLETEFETRASQQNLSNWNEVEFGYRAPRAAQYLENERQLASLGTPRAVGAPAPIRVASAEVSDDAAQSFPRMVSPVTARSLRGQVPSPAIFAPPPHMNAPAFPARSRATRHGSFSKPAWRPANDRHYGELRDFKRS